MVNEVRDDDPDGGATVHDIKMRPKKETVTPVSSEWDTRNLTPVLDNRMSWATQPNVPSSYIDDGDESPPSCFHSEDNSDFKKTYSQETCDSNFDEVYSQDSNFDCDFTKIDSQDSCYFSQVNSYEEFKEPPAKRSPSVDRRLYDRHNLPAFAHSSQSSYSSTDCDSQRSEGDSQPQF